MIEPKVEISEFLSVLDKAENGPIVSVEEWDKKYIYDTIRELVAKYDIKLDIKDPGVPDNDALADRVFEAAIELAVKSGVYCIDTQRRMIWSQDEIDTVLARVPEVIQVGAGNEAIAIKKRLPDENTTVAIGGGPWGVVVPEDLLLPLTTAYVQDEMTDFFCTAALQTTYGRSIRADSPWDTLACWQELRLTFEALERVGRPGLAIAAPNTSATAIGNVTALTYGGIRPTDYNNNSFMSEMKVSYQDLIRTCHFIQTNSMVHNFYNPIFGGYAGGAEGVAVAIVAGYVLMKACLFGDAFNSGPSHAHWSCNTFPALIPAQAVAAQSVSRNTNITQANFTRPMAGPCEKDLLYEIAAYQLATVPCGVEIATGVQTATGKHIAHCSPLEVHFLAQVAHAAEKLSRKEADPFVKKLIAKYKDGQKEMKIGKPFNETYDLEKLEPTAEWQGVYEEVFNELMAMGVPLES
jgi:methylamine---corrinoid protein Co-methyltransferase